MEKEDVIIVGAGAAGILAAISVKRNHPELKVVIIEQNFVIGRKILVSGAGRCNLTNTALGEDGWQKNYHTDSPQILDEVFAQFNYKEIAAFFSDLGIITYTEVKNNSGKVYPVTDSAKNVVLILQDELARLGVVVKTNTSCVGIHKAGKDFEVQVKQENKSVLIRGRYLIMSAGGKTYPALGANGSGYELMQKLGHALAMPVPAAGPLLAKDSICHELQGLKLPVGATLFIEGKHIAQVADDLLFTQYGVSGSLIFRISREVSLYFNRENRTAGKRNVVLQINFVPGFTAVKLAKYLNELWDKRPGLLAANSLLGIVNQKVAVALCRRAGLNPQCQVKDVKTAAREKLIQTLLQTEVEITGTRSWNESEFTAGGLRTTEFNPHTLESKLVPGLYCCGEILNVDGNIGGFNLSWAWASGWVAGKLQ